MLSKITIPFVCLLALFILNIAGLKAQDQQITILITPDDFPQDISWEVLDQDGVKVLSDNLINCAPFETCTFQGTLDANFCYTFIIRDVFGDGIKPPGGYEVSLDGVNLFVGEAFGENAKHDISCERGESCSNPIELNLPTPPGRKIRAPKDKDYWFRLVPEEFGLFRITTCVNLISGQGYPDTKLWVYANCDRDIITDGPEGALAFSDDFIQCEPASAFHYFPLEADQEYFIRFRREEDNINLDSVEIKFVKLPSIFGCTDSLSCNFNPYANIDDGSCEYSADCAPDLSLDQEELISSLYVDTIVRNDVCLVAEGCLKGPGPREVIRFSTKIDNIGDADYILGSPEDNKANFSNTNCHGHWHHDGYAEYLLFDGQGIPEPIGVKTGFCVLDLACSTEIPKYICSFMGITAGCSDIYSSAIECQWIDITDTPDGDYTMVVRVNWNQFKDFRGFDEKTYNNNWGQVCFTLDRSSGQTKIYINDGCALYSDCLGQTFGPAQVDCAGVCGGSSHFGDVDGSGELKMEDVSTYIDMLENGQEETENCYDLDGNNGLDVYDAILAFECARANDDIFLSPFHNHCLFPGGFTNVQHTADVKIVDHDEVNKTFDIHVSYLSDEIKAVQLFINGTTVTSVLKAYGFGGSHFTFSNNSIIAFHAESSIPRHGDFFFFARVTYSDFEGNEICVSPNSVVVNGRFDKINVDVSQACLFSVSTAEEEAAKASISLSPNPVSDYLVVNTEEVLLHKMEILNIDGKLIKSYNQINNSANKLDTSDLGNGVYLIRFYTSENVVVTKKFVKSSF